MSQWLSEHFRQSFVVENRAGSGGAIAAAPFGGEGGRGMPKNIENNPMQSNRESLAGMLLTDPAKTFDMSGETGAVLNAHAIAKTSIALPHSGPFRRDFRPKLQTIEGAPARGSE